MNRSQYINEFSKNNYDKFNLLLPKGEKQRAEAAAQSMGISTSKYIHMLICADLITGESKMAQKTETFTEDQYALLDKWQIARKYYEMIESLSYDKKEGYFVMLKDGYTNDATGSRAITAEKTAEIRKLIVKSHKK